MSRFTILLFLTTIFYYTVMAQPVKKGEKAPTTAELQKMMKEAQKVMDDMSSEDKKMMEEMGMKMPDLKKALPKGITNKQLQQAYDDDKLWMPRKNTALIAKASKKLASEAELKTFLTGSCANIKKGLGPKHLAEIEQVMNELKAKTGGANTTYTSAATMLMLAGKAKLALAAFSRAYEQPASTINYNDLSNFTALCNMMGGVQVSLPVLDFMNGKFPDNEIILNNIGQAWFTCGDKDQAKAFFLKCIRISPKQPQANEGLACIYMAEGNVAQAQAHMAISIKKTYSNDKENKAKKMGYNLKLSDFTMPPRMPQDPLGFTRIEKPIFQNELDNYENAMLANENWKADMNATHQELNGTYEMRNNEISEKLTKENMNKSIKDFMKTGDISKLMVNMNMNPMAIKVGSYFSKLNANSPTYAETFNKSMTSNAKEYYDAMALVTATFKAMQKEANDWIEKNCTGCGQKVSEKQCCDRLRASAAYLLASQNTLAKTKLERDIDAFTKFQREKLYYEQYMLSELAFEAVKTQTKMEFVNLLKGNQGDFTAAPCLSSKDRNVRPGKLSKFEDTHCPYEKFTISDPSGILKATFSCSGTTRELDLPFLKMTQVNDMDDKYVGGTAWIGLSAGIDRELGPLKASAEAGAGFFVEMSATQGFTDYGVTGSIEGKLGGNADVGPVPSEIKAGVNGKVSFTSGTATASGSGIFDGISVSNQ